MLSVESTNAGNKYAYDGAAILQLQYGTTHRLAGAVPGHPWYVSTDSAGAGSNAWSSSPAPSTNVDWTFTVDAAWCQQPLYGSCQYHANMGSRGAFDVSGCPTANPSAQPSAQPTTTRSPTAAPSSAPTAVEETFDDFKATFDKVYATPEEEAYRLQVFQENMDYIRANLDSDVYGVTPFIDLTVEEFRQDYLMNVSFPDSAVNVSNVSLFTFGSSADDSGYVGENRSGFGSGPWTVDWRPYSTHIFNQRDCGSCWAVSVVAQVETVWKLAGGPLRELSAQYIMECGRSSAYPMCGGNFPTVAYGVIKANNGLPLERSKPYVESVANPVCQDLPVAGGEVLDYKQIGSTRVGGQYTSKTANFLAAMDVQPVVVCINGDFGHMYKSGTLRCGGGVGELRTNKRTHCLVAVAYSESLLLLRNSWGSKHGVDGYVKMDRSSCLGHVANYAYIVSVNESSVNKYGELDITPGTGGDGSGGSLSIVLIVVIVMAILLVSGGIVACAVTSQSRAERERRRKNYYDGPESAAAARAKSKKSNNKGNHKGKSKNKAIHNAVESGVSGVL